MKNTKEKLVKKEKVLETLNAEMKTKYPPGTKIMFTGSCNQGEEPETVSCAWYDKVGAPPGTHRKHSVYKPLEWQNIPYKQAKEISAMFDDDMFMIINYVSNPHKPDTE
jgi:hypothetical protein